jgi:tetratricopeptide (TPR) repeat protein
MGWFWFVGTLVPVIGLVQVGNQAYADRYTYIPYIGLFIMLAWGVFELFSKWPEPRRQAVLWAVSVLLVVVCFWRTYGEVQYWRNGPALFRRAIEVDPKNEMAWMDLGLEYENLGKPDQGIEDITKATALNNQFNVAWYNLGKAHAMKKQYPEALDALQTALATTWFAGDKTAIYSGLADVYVELGQNDQAIADYQNSLELNKNQADVETRLGQTYVKTGQTDLAAAAFQSALNLEPDFLDADLGLAMIQQNEGHNAEAIAHYRKVVVLDTNIVIALNNLAWMLASDPDPALRNGKEAVSLAEHACDRTHYQQAFFIGTLADAYAEAGRFDDAVAAAKKAHDVALAHGEQGIADKNAELMELYKSNKPFHLTAEPSS